MTAITRRRFLYGIASVGISAGAQPAKLPADQISVRTAAVKDLAYTHLKLICTTPPREAASFSPKLEHQIFTWIDEFNASLVSRGYEKKDVVLGAAYITDSGVSFRVGDQGILGLARAKLAAPGPDEAMLESAHEYGHLYHRHGANLLTFYHPDFNTNKTPEIARLQTTYKHLFDQVDIHHELLLARKPKISGHDAEKQAQEMAVRLTCLTELALSDCRESSIIETVRWSENGFSKLPPDIQSDLKNKNRGMLEGSEASLPMSCGPVRLARHLPLMPVIK